MSEIRYKLTDENQCTYKGFKWEKNKWYKTNGTGPLCTAGWLHCYSDPLLGMFLNPIHANFKNPKVWKVEVKGESITDIGLKEGWTKMRLLEEVSVPQISTEQRIRFAILCAKVVYKEEKWNTWVDDVLSRKDYTGAPTIYSSEVGAASAAKAKAAAGAAEVVAWAVMAVVWAAEAAEGLDLITIAHEAIK